MSQPRPWGWSELGRDTYTTDEERQAEVLAWLLAQQLNDQEVREDDGSVDNLLTAAFSSRPRSHA